MAKTWPGTTSKISLTAAFADGLHHLGILAGRMVAFRQAVTRSRLHILAPTGDTYGGSIGEDEVISDPIAHFPQSVSYKDFVG